MLLRFYYASTTLLRCDYYATTTLLPHCYHTATTLLPHYYHTTTTTLLCAYFPDSLHKVESLLSWIKTKGALMMLLAMCLQAADYETCIGIVAYIAAYIVSGLRHAPRL